MQRTLRLGERTVRGNERIVQREQRMRRRTPRSGTAPRSNTTPQFLGLAPRFTPLALRVARSAPRIAGLARRIAALAPRIAQRPPENAMTSRSTADTQPRDVRPASPCAGAAPALIARDPTGVAASPRDFWTRHGIARERAARAIDSTGRPIHRLASSAHEHRRTHHRTRVVWSSCTLQFAIDMERQAIRSPP